jgi:hypothetical protein
LSQAYVSGLTSKPSGKFEAVVVFDGDQGTAGNQSLGIGNYVLSIKDAVYDKFGNKLDGNRDGVVGNPFVRSFSVYGNGPVAGQPNDVSLPTGLTVVGTPDPDDTTISDILVNSTDASGQPDTGAETSPRVASNANGDYVVVWVSKASTIDPEGNIMAQRFDRFGRALGREIQVSSYQSQADFDGASGGPQTQPNVAMDTYGNFIVTWYGVGASDMGGIYARTFDTYGNPFGDDFRVNQTITGVQNAPDVAINANGNVVFTWTGPGSGTNASDIHARRFNFLGQAQGDEFVVNSYLNYSQQFSQVAMDASGNFAVVWQSDQQDGSAWGLYGQRFNAAGQRQGGEFQVNSYTTDKQTNPQIAMDADGDFMVAWQSMGADGSGYGIYARSYSPAGVAKQSSDFRVNKTTANWQYEPSISASQDGKFVVAWASLQNDDPQVSDYGVFAHIYNADGSTYRNAANVAMDEFRVNIDTFGAQVTPTVAMDANGDVVAAWVGPDPDAPQTIPPTPSSLTAIYSRVMVLNPETYSVYTPKSPLNEFSYQFTSNSIIGGTDFAVTGTAGNDTFAFYAGASPSAWTVTVNGVKQNIPTGTTGVAIDGVSGTDTLWFYGSNGAVIADLGYEQGSFQFNGYALSFANLDYVTVSGASGSDTATLHNSAAVDTFQGLSGQAQLTAPGKALTVKNFKSVTAQGGFHDTAVMFDSPNGGSSYTAGPSGVNFVGSGFNYTAAGFTAVSAYAAAGKTNTAVFNSTDGADVLIASSLGAQYVGSGFAYDVWNLSSITGNGGAGDEARFYGSSGGNTVLNLSPTQALQTEAKYTLRGNNYGKFVSYVYPDSNTSATITGSAAVEHAVATSLGAQLTGAGLDLSAWTYKHINIVGAGGADKADLYSMGGADSFIGNGATATFTTGGVDRTITNFGTVTAHGNAASSASFFAKQGQTNTFNAGPTQASMSGTGYNNVATGFGSNTGYAIPGGTDVVNYSDSAGNDYFISSYLGSQMFGPGFSNAGWNFSKSTATSAAGADTARFYGSPTSADSFIATPTVALHATAGLSSEAKKFARVEAYAGLNTGGTAQLTGSTGDDRYIGSTLGAQLWNANYRLEAWNYASIKAEGNGGNDVSDLYGSATSNALAADNVFAQFSSGGVSNRVDHFATTKVHGSATGSDTAALDHAYVEAGVKDQPSNAQGHTILRKLWLYDFDDVKTTEKPTQTTPQPVAVDKLMSAFLYQ